RLRTAARRRARPVLPACIHGGHRPGAPVAVTAAALAHEERLHAALPLGTADHRVLPPARASRLAAPHHALALGQEAASLDLALDDSLGAAAIRAVALRPGAVAAARDERASLRAPPLPDALAGEAARRQARRRHGEEQNDRDGDRRRPPF